MKKLLSKLIFRLNRYHNRILLNEYLKRGILIFGKHTYGIENIKIDVYKGSEARLIVGKYCSIGPDVRVITGGIHPTNWVSTFPFRSKWNLPGKFEDGMPMTNGDIEIGNDVWIGTNVTILSGVNIGHGAIIATGAVVTKDIPPYSIAGGVPAKVIKKRFSDEKIKELINLKWWDWDEEKIKENIGFLNSPLSDK